MFVCAEFTASECGSNKEQATAVCALSMVREQYGESLIEKFGDPIKHVTRGSLIEGKAMHIKPQTAFSAAEDQSRKRKAEDQVTEYVVLYVTNKQKNNMHSLIC